MKRTLVLCVLLVLIVVFCTSTVYSQDDLEDEARIMASELAFYEQAFIEAHNDVAENVDTLFWQELGQKFRKFGQNIKARFAKIFKRKTPADTNNTKQTADTASNSTTPATSVPKWLQNAKLPAFVHDAIVRLKNLNLKVKSFDELKKTHKPMPEQEIKSGLAQLLNEVDSKDKKSRRRAIKKIVRAAKKAHQHKAVKNLHKLQVKILFLKDKLEDLKTKKQQDDKKPATPSAPATPATPADVKSQPAQPASNNKKIEELKQRIKAKKLQRTQQLKELVDLLKKEGSKQKKVKKDKKSKKPKKDNKKRARKQRVFASKKDKKQNKKDKKQNKKDKKQKKGKKQNKKQKKAELKNAFKRLYQKLKVHYKKAGYKAAIEKKQKKDAKIVSDAAKKSETKKTEAPKPVEVKAEEKKTEIKAEVKIENGKENAKVSKKANKRVPTKSEVAEAIQRLIDRVESLRNQGSAKFFNLIVKLKKVNRLVQGSKPDTQRINRFLANLIKKSGVVHSKIPEVLKRLRVVINATLSVPEQPQTTPTTQPTTAPTEVKTEQQKNIKL